MYGPRVHCRGLSRFIMPTKDLFQVANLLIQQHGDGALLLVMQRVLAMRLEGDGIGERVWESILDAMVDLWATEPPAGQALH